MSMLMTFFCFMKAIPSIASKRVNGRKKHAIITCKHDSFGAKHSKFGVADVAGLICFCSTKSSLQEFLDVKNTFWRQVCCFWARNMPASWEKWNKLMSVTCWSGATVCLTAVKIQMFGGKTRHVWHATRTIVSFCLVSTFRCNRR